MDKQALVEAIKECARFEEGAALTLGELHSKKMEWEGVGGRKAKAVREEALWRSNSSMRFARCFSTVFTLISRNRRSLCFDTLRQSASEFLFRVGSGSPRSYGF
jgi:hypothetical protein